MIRRPRSTRPVRGALQALFLAVVVGACGTVGDPYFQPYAGNVGVGYPIQDGIAVYVGLGAIRARAGDTVVIERIEINGATGFRELAALARPGGPVPSSGYIGLLAEPDLLASGFDPGAYRRAEGFEFSESDGPVEIVIRAVAEEVFASFASVTIVFRVNGGLPESQTFPFSAIACPHPSSSPDPDATCNPL